VTSLNYIPCTCGVYVTTDMEADPTGDDAWAEFNRHFCPHGRPQAVQAAEWRERSPWPSVAALLGVCVAAVLLCFGLCAGLWWLW
jgi:hypothetical protein